MKLFGSLSELVSIIFRKDTRAITVRPNQGTTYTADRDVQLPPQDAAGVLVSADSTQTLTNKTISGAGNMITNVSLSTGVTGTLPVGNGGTGITSGTSGGLPYFSASNTIASSAALVASQVVTGGGAGSAPVTASATNIVGAGEGSTPTSTTLRGPAAAGANVAGAVLNIDASNGTGTGGSGNIVLRTAPVAGSSSSSNSFASVLTLDKTGGVTLGPAGVTTTMMHAINTPKDVAVSAGNSTTQGSIKFTNGTSSGSIPTITMNSGEATNASSAIIIAQTKDGNTNGDLQFNVTGNNAGNHATLTNKAYSWQADATGEIGSVTRAGAWVLGSTAAIGGTTNVGSKIVGSTNGVAGTNAAVTGHVGEVIRSGFGRGGGPSITSTTIANITSISLTPGDWDMRAIWAAQTSGASTAMDMSINTTSATQAGVANLGFPSATGQVRYVATFSATDPMFTSTAYSLTVTATTTYYLVVAATFVGTGTAYGLIEARRIR